MEKPKKTETLTPDAPSPKKSEIDTLVEQAEPDFVISNLATLRDAGASVEAIVAKLSSDMVIDHALELTLLGVSKEIILSRLDDVFEALEFHDRLVAAGIVIDPEWALKSLLARIDKIGRIPYKFVEQIYGLIDMGISIDVLLALIRQDENYPVVLIQTAKRLISRGADISIDEINRAIDEVRPPSRYSDKIIENLRDLVSLGADINPSTLVEEYTKERKHNANSLVLNIDQVIAVSNGVDLDEIIKNASSYAIKPKIHFLLNRGADPRILAEQLSYEILEANMSLFIREYKKHDYSVDSLINSIPYFDRVLWNLDEFMAAGASKKAVLDKCLGFGVLRNLDKLIDKGFTIDELVGRLSAYEKIESFGNINRRGAKINLDEVVDVILGKDFSDYFGTPEDAVDFLLKHLKTFINNGVDIMKIMSRDDIREIIEKKMTKEQKLFFALAELKSRQD